MRQPALRLDDCLFSPASRGPAGVKGDIDRMSPGPRDEIIIGVHEARHDKGATQQRDAAPQLFAVDAGKSILNGEGGQMAFGGKERPLAVWMSKPHRNSRFCISNWPKARNTDEGLLQETTKLVVADVGGDLEWGVERSPCQRHIARRATGSHFVVFDKRLGARRRPGLNWAHDEIDVDVTDDGEGTHGASLRPRDLRTAPGYADVGHARGSKG